MLLPFLVSPLHPSGKVYLFACGCRRGAHLMDTLIGLVEKAAILVVLMFILGRTGFLARLTTKHARYDTLLAFGLFTLMALTESWVAAQKDLLLDAHFIATCTAGLVAGPWVGLGVGASSGTFAAVFGHQPPASYYIPAIAGGFLAGLVRWRFPALALRPLVGFTLALLLCIAWYLLEPLFGFARVRPMQMEFLRGLVNGGGVALLLLVACEMRQMDLQARAVAMAEVRALQARMNPHFLFNALNTIAALARSDPDAIPSVTARFARFLRASLEQHDRPFVPLREELEIVAAYLEIEQLRFGPRLEVEQQLVPEVLDTPVPPFLVQPLVENAVRHGARGALSRGEESGLVRLVIRPEGDQLCVTVEDNGPGIPAERRREVLLGPPDGAHALALLRRRLRSLYDNSFRLALEERPGGGAITTVCVPRSTPPLPTAPGEKVR